MRIEKVKEGYQYFFTAIDEGVEYEVTNTCKTKQEAKEQAEMFMNQMETLGTKCE